MLDSLDVRGVRCDTREVKLGAVWVGVFAVAAAAASCSGSGPAASGPFTSPNRATAALNTCLKERGATSKRQSTGVWKVKFADGRSLTYTYHWGKATTTTQPFSVPSSGGTVPAVGMSYTLLRGADGHTMRACVRKVHLFGP
jgi:hypothetical protein